MEDKTVRLKIEELLVAEGFVSSQEMAEARVIRKTHIAQSKKQLGFILLGQKKITQDQLTRLLSLPEMQTQIGKRAVEKAMISQDQLEECQREAKTGHRLSQRLFTKGYFSEGDRKELVYEQLDTLFLAKQAIKHRLIQEQDLESAIKLKNYKKSTCEILYEQNRVALSELNHAFRSFSRDLKLGQILLQQDMIHASDLEKALTLQADAHRALGKILVENKWVALNQLYFALSIQYNTPFQKLGGYIYYEKQKVDLRNIIGQRHASEHQILPLFWNGDNLTLGVSNPARIWSMQGLKTRYPKIQMTCVLITDEKFEQLYALLYGEVLPRPVTRFLSGRQTSDEVVVVIDHLKNQRAQIKSLYQAYKTQMELAGEDEKNPREEIWFMEFIEESFTRICNTYGCSGVQFRCIVNGWKPELFASPVP
jgi:MshEN domain